MELQLGLALPTHHNPTKGFDLNNHLDTFDAQKSFKNKRSFEEAFGKIIRDELQKMPNLLLWSGQPNEEDDDREGRKMRDSSTINKEEGEEKPVVGWPPIQSWRKKLLHHHDHHDQVGRIENNYHNRMVHDHHQKENGGSNSKFVKVKMEGVAVTRKVDLRLYHSLSTLKNSLIAIFAKYKKCEKGSVRYTLNYQDKEGVWLPAEDVPWRTFIESVQRLEILRNGG